MENGAGVSAGSSDPVKEEDALPEGDELMSWFVPSLDPPAPCNASLWQQDEYNDDDMLPKLGSDFTVLLLPCSDDVPDIVDKKEEVGIFNESDDNEEGLISELDEFDELRG